MTQRSAFMAFLAILIVAGCGGGGGGSSPSATGGGTGGGGGKGVAILNVAWPDRSRAIPLSSNSLVLSLSHAGTTVVRQAVNRPFGNAPSSSVEFDGLPVGDLVVTLDAYPAPDGDGTAQGFGTETIHLSGSTPTTIPVSLASTVATLTIDPPAGSLGLGDTVAVSVGAHDAAGNVVLLSTGVATEQIAWTTSDPSVVSVAGTGPTVQVAGLAEGTSTLRATLATNDAGGSVSGQVAVSCASTGGTVIVK